MFRTVRDSPWRRSRLVVIGYQGVSLADEHEWDPSSYVSPGLLRRRLELLERNQFRVLPLFDAVESLRRGDLPPRAVALTFDDGMFDFHAVVWPMLKSFGYPATVFLTTYYCDFNRPVFDVACSYILWKASRSVARLEAVSLGLERDLEIATARDRQQARDLLFAVSRQWRMNGEAKDFLLERLADAGGVDYAALCSRRLLHLMRPEEVRELAAEGVQFQLHTHRHRAPLDRALFQREIRENRSRIAALTGRTPQCFCYPCGSHRSEFLEWLPAEEVLFAATCDPGAASPASPALLLPRLVDHGKLTQIEFESYVAGVGFFIPGWWNRAGIPRDLSRLHATHGF